MVGGDRGRRDVGPSRTVAARDGRRRLVRPVFVVTSRHMHVLQLEEEGSFDVCICEERGRVHSMSDMRRGSGLELESQASHARDVVLDELTAFLVCL
jgi:hypothetical protein